MARVQKFEKVSGRIPFLRRLRKPETAAAYLASVLRDGDKIEIQTALSDIAEANKIDMVSPKREAQIRKAITALGGQVSAQPAGRVRAVASPRAGKRVSAVSSRTAKRSAR